MDADSGLKSIERRIFQARGVLYEGDVFSILLHSPFVVRSFEFGLADGAVDCTGGHEVASSYADRFWDIYDRRHTTDAVDLLLFDVKSTVAGTAGEQIYLASTAQQKRVAFFIGITAADPAYVEVIPNYSQVSDEDGIDTAGESTSTREVSINTTRNCKLPASAYGGLDQCSSPYRIPIWHLSEAIARIRRCAQGLGTYINPHNGLAFPHWQPHLTRTVDALTPSIESDQHAAYELILDILRFTNQGDISNIRLDFVGTQPRLADFRLLVAGRTYWIQHKLDLTLRAVGNTLSQVPIARGEGEERRYYFSAFDRFDFLWYQFSFSRGGGRTEDVFFLIPERALPDAIFRTTDKMFDLTTVENLEDFRIVMDDRAHWLHEVERMVLAHPQPRKHGDRPLRPEDTERAMAGAVPKMEPKLHHPPVDRKGRHEFAQVMTVGIRRFFRRIMEECAHRLSGLLVVFATNHPVLDLGFCRYRWTGEERQRFLKYGYPPKVAHQLPSQTAIVPICYYTQSAECSFQGPNLRAAHFRRLNSSSHKRLIVWDIGGSDNAALSPIIIPSDDFSPTASQRDIFAKNVSLNKNAGQRDSPNPSLSAVLNSGLHCADYAAGCPLGPVLYEHESWASVWELLAKFSSPETVEHPPGFARNPGEYSHSLQALDDSLRLQHEHSEASVDALEY